MSVAFIFAFTLGENIDATVLGDTVTNTASFSYTGLEGKPVTVLTNDAKFVIEARRTESIVEFFRYSPNAPEANLIQINGSDFSPSGAEIGPFVSMPVPNYFTSNTSNEPSSIGRVRQEVPLIPTTGYFAGEVIFICVEDFGQNGDSERIETISAVLKASSGDQVVLRLYEDGPDTGRFWAFVHTSREDTQKNDGVLTTRNNSHLIVTYTDFFDNTEVSIDDAVVGQYSRIFNGSTGELVDHAKITLIDNKTGQPALVYGTDGISIFPSEVISGSSFTDEGGFKYTLEPGEFIFPIVPRGDYSLRVDPPDGLSFASLLTPEYFAALPNGPFAVIEEASYGKAFNHNLTGTVSLDIPLDAEAQFVVQKTTAAKSGDVGDFIEYNVSIENNSANNVPLLLRDTLPKGFRYKAGSSRLGGKTLEDPEVLLNGGELIYRFGIVPALEKLELSYVLVIGAGAGKKGSAAINSIVAVNGSGKSVSNISHAKLELREDLLRSRGTIIGRISENACEGDAAWARKINKGKGVAGVRLYMENGAYAISDENGLYHFEGVKPGTHVVQMDVETLPDGYVSMVCEENSQYAGRSFSKFVETQGGSTWRANFYLKKTAGEKISRKHVQFNDQTEYKQYDGKWLSAQSPQSEWVYPSPKRTPSTPSVNIGIKHGPDQKVSLRLNGQAVPKANFASRDSDTKRQVMMSKWRGVDVLEGKNAFIATVVDLNGATVSTLKRDIYYVKTIARVTPLPDQSVLVADGRTKPELALRLEDEAGRPVHAGRIAKIDIAAPYSLYNKSRLGGKEELVAPLSAAANIIVKAGGVARVVLQPTLQSGKVTMIATLDDGRKVELSMNLKPEKRDWILVGLSEGSIAYNQLNNNALLGSGALDDLSTDGRIAFFAKGLIKGDWILTLAVDTDKRRGDRDGDFEGKIDPNAYYTLYGDRSNAQFEAQSRYPLYLKLEKNNFSAMFGDFDTNITEGKLTRYSRHLSGFKAEYLGENFQSTLYAAETNQGFAKDEIAANGTSGPYYLSNRQIIANSDTIVIETRDRVRPDLILDTRRLIRHLDYTLDTYSGEIIFRLPVDVSDSGFNPNVIVASYETSNDAEGNVSFGGRIQKKLMQGRVQIGSTFVHEGGNENASGSKSDMVGADVIVSVGKNTEARAEYALSRTNQDSATNGYKTSTAYLAEIIHTSEKLTADAYVRQEEKGYGVGQTNSNTNSVRRFGANVAYKFQELVSKKTGRRGSLNLSASTYKEENLGNGNSRTSSEVKISQESEVLSASAGLRHAQDKTIGGAGKKSLLALASARYTLPKFGLSAQISHEQPLNGNDSVGDHPQRTRLEISKSLTKKANVKFTHDILNGSNAKSQNSAVGVDFSPWAGTSITAGSDMILSTDARKIGATIGLDQQFQINEKWSASGGLTNRRIISSTGVIAQIAPDDAISPLEINENYISAYAGLGYRTLNTSASARLETRKSSAATAYVASIAAAREVSKSLSFAGRMRAGIEDKNSTAVESQTRIDSRIGMAWRPHGENMIVLNRFDVVYDTGATGTKTTKLVNNLSANAQVLDRLQIAANYGVKYVQTEVSNANFSGLTQLFGGEVRFDISEKIDIGLQGSALFEHSSDTLQYAFGPSIGLSPVDNVWLSLGYNAVGYKDLDFAAAEYSQQGAYLKFRFKFDQLTARGLLNALSPDRAR